jgi:hypothetical protein
VAIQHRKLSAEGFKDNQNGQRCSWRANWRTNKAKYASTSAGDFWLYLRRFSIEGFNILVMDESGCSMYFYPKILGFCGCGMEYSVLLNRLLLPLWRRMI